MVSCERVRLAYNNLYIVEDAGRVVVIDTGPDYRGARETILDALHGRTPEVVVATHGHLDHAGLGNWWQERGVPVLLGVEDLPQALGQNDHDIDLMEGYIEHIGAPRHLEKEIIAGLEQRRRWSSEMRRPGKWPEARDGRWPTALRYEPFQPGRTAGGPVQLPCGLSAVPAPGHTPGNLVVLHEGEGWLFSGDTLLPEITPTPAIQFHQGRRFPSLPRFLASLEALDTRQPPPAHCFPGHGEPFDNVPEVIEENLRQAHQRSERLYESLREEGPATVYAIAERLYPRALRRRFWQIIATIQGHLDTLEEAGRARYDGGRWSA